MTDLSLSILKYIVLSKIDGNWGAGDDHLKTLEVLIELDSDDTMIVELYQSLKAQSEEWTEEKTEEYIDKLMDGMEKFRISRPRWRSLKNEMVYRDAGKDEANYYYSSIVSLKGEEFMENVNEIYWS